MTEETTEILVTVRFRALRLALGPWKPGTRGTTGASREKQEMAMARLESQTGVQKGCT